MSEFIRKKKKKHIPNILMLCNNRIEFNGSLLQFQHKISFVLNNYIFDPPTDGIQRTICNFTLEEMIKDQQIIPSSLATGMREA